MKNTRDMIYRESRNITPFTFDETVASVFPDMINRSVPGYAAAISGSGVIAAKYAQPGSNCYDLGCSVGATTYAMAESLTGIDCTIIAIDNSQDMIREASSRVGKHTVTDIRWVCADIRDIKITNASVVALNYTLQFIPVEDRATLLQRIYQGMNDDGVILISEKICFENRHEQEEQTRLHENFKRLQGYSELEISQKRAALENVLVPETQQVHIDRLAGCGFRNTQAWFRCFNFISLLAWK